MPIAAANARPPNRHLEHYHTDTDTKSPHRVHIYVPHYPKLPPFPTIFAGSWRYRDTECGKMREHGSLTKDAETNQAAWEAAKGAGYGGLKVCLFF
jgi:hypothetical protein